MPTWRDTAPLGVGADDAAQPPMRRKSFARRFAGTVVVFWVVLHLLALLGGSGHPQRPNDPAPVQLPMSAIRGHPCPAGAKPLSLQRSYGRAYVVCSDGITTRP